MQKRFYLYRRIVMKKLTVLLMMIVGMLPAIGETVSQKQAQQLAHLFFNEAAGRVNAPPKLIYNGRKLTTNRLFTPFYVYNNPVGGFVIISAENKAYPILGFSLKDSFNPERLGDTELALLKTYALEIEHIRYDVQPVENTIKAWQNYPEYVSGILNAQYIATDPKLSIEESDEMLIRGINDDDAIYADMYNPDQWQEMILEELNSKESVPLMIVGDNRLFPMVVYGHQGDYFRIEMTRRNSWLMRLNATDVISPAMVTVVGNPLEMIEEYEEELPFEVHDSFLAEVDEIENNRREVASIDIPIFNDKPQVLAIGGGHFDVVIPENASMATVYNISGSMISRQTFRDTPLVHLDISAEPSGFYFLTVTGESGTPYGLKLNR